MKLILPLFILFYLSACSTYKPVKRCLSTIDSKTQQETEYSLCKTLWLWE